MLPRGNRPQDVALRWVIIIGVLGTALYAAFWAYTHPNHPFTPFVIGGIILFFVIARFFRRFLWVKNLVQRDKNSGNQQ